MRTYRVRIGGYEVESNGSRIAVAVHKAIDRFIQHGDLKVRQDEPIAITVTKLRKQNKTVYKQEEK